MLAPMRLVGRRDGVVEADQRVVDERRRVGDAVQEHGRPSGRCREGEIDLLREDGDRACRLQPARVGDREADRYRVKPLKSCPVVGIVNVPLVTPVIGVPGCTCVSCRKSMFQV